MATPWGDKYVFYRLALVTLIVYHVLSLKTCTNAHPPSVHRKSAPGKATHAVSTASGTHTYTDEEKYVFIAVATQTDAKLLRIWKMWQTHAPLICSPSCGLSHPRASTGPNWTCLTEFYLYRFAFADWINDALRKDPDLSTYHTPTHCLTFKPQCSPTVS